jgi:hypothetical protein
MKKHIVCYSGGHSSALVAIEVVRRFGASDIVLLNHDISPRVEDADIKRFKVEVAEYLGVKITFANHPRWKEWDQFDVCEDAQAFKVGRGPALCTHRLKTEPFDRWLDEHAPISEWDDDGILVPPDVVIYYGFDKNETARIQRRSSILGERGYRTAYPLATWERTIKSTREVNIEPPATYSVFKHANCVGCLKAKKQHWYAVFCTRPDIWQRAREAEESIGYTIQPVDSIDDMEPMFRRMKCAGIEPTEHINPSRFWIDAKRKIRSSQMDLFSADQSDDRPCECVF